VPPLHIRRRRVRAYRAREGPPRHAEDRVEVEEGIGERRAPPHCGGREVERPRTLGLRERFLAEPGLPDPRVVAGEIGEERSERGVCLEPRGFTPQAIEEGLGPTQHRPRRVSIRIPDQGVRIEHLALHRLLVLALDKAHAIAASFEDEELTRKLSLRK
jgi:hypothetical protein